MNRDWLAAGSVVLLGVLGVVASIERPTPPGALSAGWGVDACLSGDATGAVIDSYVPLLRAGNLRYLRERTIFAERGSARRNPAFERLRGAGFEVVGWAGLPPELRPEHRWDQYTADLLAIYEAARRLGALYAGVISVWELPNEPDVLWVKDLPDRFAAHSKALYLGLKDGARAGGGSPGVLMGALGHYPGPWLDRAAANGIFDYTDGLNFHFYGHARDLRGVIDAQREYAKGFVTDRELPLWITECGIMATPPDNVGERRGRAIQRAFVEQTARTAWRSGVAIFMPFILAWAHEESFALTHSASEPYPAWEAYAAFARAHPMPAKPALAPPANPPRVVVQWQADNKTCIPHKVSGTYWFRHGTRKASPIDGRIVVYNFSDQPVRGSLEVDGAAEIEVLAGPDGAEFARQGLELPAFGAVAAPVRIRSRSGSYFRVAVMMRFVPEGGVAASRAVIGVETRPTDRNLTRRLAVTGFRPPEDGFQWIWAPESFEGLSAGGPWIGVNDVAVADGGGGPSRDLAETSRFTVRRGQTDPRLPPMAVTRVHGLPEIEDGFLRVRIGESEKYVGSVRVDLVDRFGQRFSVAESLGQNRFRPDAHETFLAYKDLHLYAWGRCTRQPRFNPRDVREIQLRFFPEQAVSEFAITIDVVGGR